MTNEKLAKLIVDGFEELGRADVLEFLDGQRVPDAIRSSPSGKEPPPQ
jgi:hypothetical protein